MADSCFKFRFYSWNFEIDIDDFISTLFNKHFIVSSLLNWHTISKDKRIEQEGALIRRATVERSVPCMTSLDTAKALLLALAAHSAGEPLDVATVDEYLHARA